MEAVKKGRSSTPTDSRGEISSGGIPRRWRLLFGVALLATATLGAFRQEPRLEVWRPVDPLSLDWWLNRLETNAFRRIPVVTADLYQVFSPADGRAIWMVGDDGFILHSPDGGRTWERQDPGELEPIPGLEPPPSGVAREPSPILGPAVRQMANEAPETESQDTGAAVEGESPVRRPRLQAVHFVGQLRGWIAGEAGTILATSDGGETWRNQTAPTEAELRSIHFLSDGRRGWAAGAEGVILATANGGEEWERQISSTAGAIHSIRFDPDGWRGWAVGDGETILVTEDGGETWLDRRGGGAQQMASGYGSGPFLAAVSFSAPQASFPQSYEPVPGTTGPRRLRDVQFPAGVGGRGWVVGEGGAILVSDDGGNSWSQIDGVTSRDLLAVHFTDDGLRGWLVGRMGEIIATSDGGKSWAAQPGGPRLASLDVESRTGLAVWNPDGSPPVSLNSVSPLSDGQALMAVGDGGVQVGSFDGGTTWRTLNPRLFSIAVDPGGERIWISGESGVMLSSRDGGARWAPLETGVQSPIHCVRFFDRNLGWAGGAGVLLRTEDGGRSWFPSESGNLDQVEVADLDFFPGGQSGWALAPLSPPAAAERRLYGGGLWLTTTDRGATWSSRGLPFEPGLAGQFLDPSRGWILGRYYTRGGPSDAIVPHATSDGGATWRRQSIDTASLSDIQFLPDARRGWAAGADGVHATVDGGGEWVSQLSGHRSAVNSIHVLDDGRGWAVDNDGGILTLSDGSWTLQAGPTLAPLRAVRFLDDGRRGWAVGDGPTILRTLDGGETWAKPLYRNHPAPWYFLFGGLVFFVVILPALRQREPEVAPSVADVLASDRPIRKGDRDPLDFTRIAGGVSRFLANESTEPPLTLAVKGEWGTGKTSLMNLIRDDLKQYGFPTVWFNAWHHQTEEHLLGSLMENIQRQAIPAWWTFQGLAFRVRLLYIRGVRNWVPTLLLTVLFAAVVGYLAEDPAARVESLRAWFEEASKLQIPQEQWGPLLALLTVLFGPALALQRGLRTFGSSTSFVLAGLLGAFRVNSPQVDVGFRERFAQTFGEVTQALKPKKLTIFVDDLDRCQPDKAVRVLEMINFLVVSGDCYVVVGMAPEWVVRAVGLGFKEVAAEMSVESNDGAKPFQLVGGAAKGGAAEGPDRARRVRHEFAHNYLEKLINIEVPLPRPPEEAVRELLTPPEPAVYAGWDKLRRRIGGWVKTYAPAAGLATVVLVAYWQGPGLLTGWVPEAESSHLAEASPETAGTMVVDEPGVPAPQPTPTATQPETPRVPVVYEEGDRHTPALWPYFLAIGAILAVGLFRLALGPKRLEKDSPAFRKALEIWYPLVYHRRATPRSVKRFLNRVRYYAMCQRERREARSLTRRLIDAYRGRSRSDAWEHPSGWIPEDVLVALAAIQEAWPDATAGGELNSFAEFLSRRENLPEKLAARLDEIRRYPRPAPYLERFRRMSQGIEIRR